MIITLLNHTKKFKGGDLTLFFVHSLKQNAMRRYAGDGGGGGVDSKKETGTERGNGENDATNRTAFHPNLPPPKKKKLSLISPLILPLHLSPRKNCILWEEQKKHGI